MGKLNDYSFLAYVKRTVKFFLIAVLLGVLLFIGYAFYTGVAQTKIKNAYEKTKEKTLSSFHKTLIGTGFVVDAVFIEGHKYTQRSDIEKAIDLKNLLGQSMSLANTQKIKENISHLPWIKRVSVQRKLPNTLSVFIEEKTPIALWQKDGKHTPLDEDGNIIKAPATPLPALIISIGEDAPKHTPKLMGALDKYPHIKSRVLSTVRIGKRRWNLILDDLTNGMTIYLPDTNWEKALDRLDSLNKTEKILSRPLSLIDLRFEDKLIVKTLDNLPDTSIGTQEDKK